MRLFRLSAVALIAVVSAIGLAHAQRPTDKRDVVLEVTLPNGNTPQLRITEGETGSIRLQAGATTFGFVPTISEGVVTVALFDLDAVPSQKLDEVQAVIGGDAVKSKTTPAFGVRALRVVTR